MKNKKKTTRVEGKLEYQESLLNLHNELLSDLVTYAKENDVPIMQDEGMAFLITVIKLIKAKKILEIGSAIGYSSLMMNLNTNAKIDTIEISEDMYKVAKENIKRFNKEKDINLILGDALLQFDLLKDNKYDLIFIDAAKGQYEKFFKLYSPLLKKGGVILCDNLYFHDLLFTEIESRNLRQLVRKIDTFNQFIKDYNEFETHVFKIGDGISISIKKWVKKEF